MAVTSGVLSRQEFEAELDDQIGQRHPRRAQDRKRYPVRGGSPGQLPHACAPDDVSRSRHRPRKPGLIYG